MILTITTTYRPAGDLGFLLHKNPSRVQVFELSFGKAYVFYPVVEEERCTAALLLDVDPVGLVCGRGQNGGLEPYVNDRPYVASSLMSVAIGEVFGTALAARSRERPQLVELAIPLRAEISVLPCRGGGRFPRRLFEPLGYAVVARRHPLDERFPEWGESAYFSVALEQTIRLRDLLAHLYVLIPVLDDDKHYWVDRDEVEKLLRRGEGWLAAHPERNEITRRYLRRQGRLTRDSLARLVVDDGAPDPDAAAEAHAEEEAAVEERISLSSQRTGAVIAALKASGARRVLDLGCGEGRLLRTLVDDGAFDEVVGVDVSHRALDLARRRLERLPERKRERVKILQGSPTYRDDRLAGFDAAAVVEVIEHLDPPRLAAFERVLFQHARPRVVVLTTPNVEYNATWESLPAGKLRHRDHRFEWTRAEFQVWASGAAGRFGYEIRFVPIGPEDPALGPPTQMGVFTRE